MKEIVVLSGKGGTGKTSVTASLAVLAGERVVVADCDVDAANMHLLLDPSVREAEEVFSGELAVVDEAACDLCGECYRVCRFDAVCLTSHTAVIDPLACEGCGYCATVCPRHAITMRPRRSGSMYISLARSGNILVHARLDAGAENSGKLVARVKGKAREIAENSGTPYVLVDGSPGIGCPVISSLSGANMVLMVTEPTMSALHDLKRLQELIRGFRIPSACIVNRCDLNPVQHSLIVDYLGEEGIPCLASIPFDMAFTRSMTRALTIVETDAPAGKQLKGVWERLQDMLENVYVQKK